MIPFFTLQRQNLKIEDELKKAINEVINNSVYILGRKVCEFEEKFAQYIGVKYAVGVASGTDALSIALLATGVKNGNEVILPANSYPTAFAITAIGAIPKLVDIYEQTYNIDPDKIVKAITGKTKAIIAVHLYGRPCEMEKIMAIGQKYHIPIIEDCAQAHGAEIRIKAGPAAKDSQTMLQNRPRQSRTQGREASFGIPLSRHPLINFIWKKVGSFGDVGCFSFYPTKNLGCFGDGGMVVTNNKDIYENVKLLRMYGEKTRYNSILLGRNSRLDELQAAILLVKLKHLDEWNKRRREIAQRYLSHFSESAEVGYDFFPHLPVHPLVHLRRTRGVQEPVGVLKKHSLPTDSFHVFHLFVIRSKKRDQMRRYLVKKGIQTAVHFPTPIHLQKSFQFLEYKKGDFPIAEQSATQILSLPIFPELTDQEITQVVSQINSFFI